MKLTAEQREQWERRGFVVFRNWLTSAEVASVCALAEEIQFVPDALHPFEVNAEGENGPSRTEDFADFHPKWGDFFRTGKLPSLISSVLGEKVVLYKEKLNYKMKNGGGGYKAHQDGYTTFHRQAPDYSFITAVCMIAIDAFTVENGCPEVAPETWAKKQGFLHQGRGLPESGQFVYPEMGPFIPIQMERCRYSHFK
jgi:ectoine hydroxylase-related dioxygenase (phytanoyl-CoA dioxygenase family)